MAAEEVQLGNTVIQVQQKLGLDLPAFDNFKVYT
jgi:hypothetical protein